MLEPASAAQSAGPGAAIAGELAAHAVALSRMEVLYGGWQQLWGLPLQVSSYNDTLFSPNLARRAPSVAQASAPAKPKPPTNPGFGEHLMFTGRK